MACRIRCGSVDARHHLFLRDTVRAQCFASPITFHETDTDMPGINQSYSTPHTHYHRVMAQAVTREKVSVHFFARSNVRGTNTHIKKTPTQTTENMHEHGAHEQSMLGCDIRLKLCEVFVYHVCFTMCVFVLPSIRTFINSPFRIEVIGLVLYIDDIDTHCVGVQFNIFRKRRRPLELIVSERKRHNK